ncbi:MAG: hypothetical protein R3321_05120 [Nitrososphaeraceae archaeon]|nr:hypothetical protein [Nitrososphaeraceae archaeon]
MTEAHKPEKTYRSGSITATIWKNKKDDKEWHTISVIRNYKDGETWKQTSSMQTRDLPDVILVCRKAHEWLRLKDK